MIKKFTIQYSIMSVEQKKKTPAGVIAPLIPNKQPRAMGKGIDPALEAEIDRAEAIARQSNKGGGITVNVPVQGGTATPPAREQSTPEAEKAAIADKVRLKMQQRQGVR